MTLWQVKSDAYWSPERINSSVAALGNLIKSQGFPVGPRLSQAGLKPRAG